MDTVIAALITSSINLSRTSALNRHRRVNDEHVHVDGQHVLNDTPANSTWPECTGWKLSKFLPFEAVQWVNTDPAISDAITVKTSRQSSNGFSTDAFLPCFFSRSLNASTASAFKVVSCSTASIRRARQPSGFNRVRMALNDPGLRLPGLFGGFTGRDTAHLMAANDAG
jgi:hypothetical protein